MSGQPEYDPAADRCDYCDVCGEETGQCICPTCTDCLTPLRNNEGAWVSQWCKEGYWVPKPFCRSCARQATGQRIQNHRSGFTLIELLVVILILSVLIVGVGRVLPGLNDDRRLTSGAAIVKNKLDEAGALAQSSGASGLRLVPDQLKPLARLADGTLDPSQVLTYSRLVPLEQPRLYRVGLASIHVDGYPAGFTPAPGRLVLEESPVDAAGQRCEPTSWWGVVRVGDLIEVASHVYVVTGPMVLGPGDGNPGRLVNIGPQGTTSPLLRPGALKDELVPVEWLYLANRHDDDRDGFTDEGHDGLDNDLDGFIDEDDEWEAETWRGTADSGLLATSYTLTPRLVPVESKGVLLPASVVIDATGWVTSRARSRLPVDPYTGDVDLIFDKTGPVDSPSIYGRPANRPLSEGYLHLWVSGIADVASPPTTTGDGRLVTVDLRTGRTTSGYADAANVDGTFADAEGGSR